MFHVYFKASDGTHFDVSAAEDAQTACMDADAAVQTAYEAGETGVVVITGEDGEAIAKFDVKESK